MSYLDENHIQSAVVFGSVVNAFAVDIACAYQVFACVHITKVGRTRHLGAVLYSK